MSDPLFPQARRSSLPPEIAAIQQKSILRLQDWQNDPNVIYLGLATTDLPGVPVQLVALDAYGRKVLDLVIRSDRKSSPEAQRIHGVTPEMVARGVEIRAALDQLDSLTPSRLLMFTPKFVNDALSNAGEGHKLPMAKLGWGQVTLSSAIGAYNVQREFFPTRSLSDLWNLTDLSTFGLSPLGSALGNLQRFYMLVQWAANNA